MLTMVRFLFTMFFVIPLTAMAQLSVSEADFFARLSAGGPMPEKILSTRSVVIYPHTVTAKELKEIQLSFQQTGIDAVAYFGKEILFGGKDIASAYAYYLNQRGIVNLIFLTKDDGKYGILITGFNGKDTFIDQSQTAWRGENQKLAELLKIVYRSSSSLERGNYLINDFPETELPVQIVRGRRSEFYAIDLKVDQLAVPKTGNESIDKELELIFGNYPFKYQLTEPTVSEKELRAKGFFYIVSYVHARGSVIRQMLGYDVSKVESAYVSVTYPNGQSQLKNIPADVPVYKFYFKHIDSGNIFLGTKWDAAVTWQKALTNYIAAFKAELGVN
jgi:hypothetical protein